MLGICFDDMGSGKGQAPQDMFIPLAIVVFGCFFLCCRNMSCSVKGIEGPPLMVTLQNKVKKNETNNNRLLELCLL
jgi:hypothetical protein